MSNSGDGLAPTPEPNKTLLVPIIQDDGTEKLGPLPPIADIEIPHTATTSAKVRWLYALGYKIAEIYPFVGIRYQMVRNIVTTIPKRMAREDLPPLKVKYKPQKDVITEGLDAALDASLLADRKARKKVERDLAKSRGEATTDEE